MNKLIIVVVVILVSFSVCLDAKAQIELKWLSVVGDSVIYGNRQYVPVPDPPAGDLNGDGRADLFLTFNNGYVLIDGVSGNVIWSRAQSNGNLRYIGDIDSDGVAEFLAVHPFIGPFTQRITFVDGADGQDLWEYDFGSDIDYYGLFFSDVDGDNMAELIYTSRDTVFCYEISWATAIPDDPDQVPDRVELSPSYPNPFNPSTTIEYSLSQAENVRIEVINTLGQVVTVLRDERQPAGSYSLQWDGRNDAGQAVATGAYFYRLTTDSETRTRKMMLLK